MEFLGLGKPSANQVEKQVMHLRKDLANQTYKLEDLRKKSVGEYNLILETVKVIYDMIINCLSSKTLSDYDRKRVDGFKKETEGVFRRLGKEELIKRM